MEGSGNHRHIQLEILNELDVVNRCLQKETCSPLLMIEMHEVFVTIVWPSGSIKMQKHHIHPHYSDYLLFHLIS